MKTKKKRKRKALIILMSMAMAFSMMLMMGGTAYAEGDEPETCKLTFHWSSIDGEDIDGQPPIIFTDIQPGTTIAEVLSRDNENIWSRFFFKEGYDEWSKGSKPLSEYSNIEEINQDYLDETTPIEKNMDIYCLMFKHIEDKVTVTVKPPLCGVKTDTEKADDSDFGWNFFSQTNRPIVTLPKDAAYIAVPEDPAYVLPTSWWSGDDWTSVYRGSFVNGESYNFTIRLMPKLGWMFNSPYGEGIGITLEGGEVLNSFTEYDLYVCGATNAVHNWKGATCTEADKCKGCGVTQGKALGHAYGSWTKLNANQHQKVCKHDKSHVVKENHKWDAGKVTKKATEKQTGVRTYTCTVCKAAKTASIPKLKPSAPKVSGAPLARMTAGKTSLTISWKKIQGAAGYDIFFARCNHHGKKIACKKVKTIKGNKTFKWTGSGLKKGTSYKAYVKAYVYKKGKKTYVKTSPMMHAYTGNGTKYYTNAKSVTVNKTKVTLKKGKTFKITAKVNKVSKKKKLMPKSHAPVLRYMTSNSKIAAVSSSGRITAKGKGTCTVYAYAHNGVAKGIKVTVK